MPHPKATIDQPHPRGPLKIGRSDTCVQQEFDLHAFVSSRGGKKVFGLPGFWGMSWVKAVKGDMGDCSSPTLLAAVAILLYSYLRWGPPPGLPQGTAVPRLTG